MDIFIKIFALVISPFIASYLTYLFAVKGNKIQTTHQKQIDAIHLTYQAYQQLLNIIKNPLEPEIFSSSLNINEKMNLLITYRHNFKNVFLENKLIFTERLCAKIERVLPVIDKNIEDYEAGILNEISPSICKNL